MMKLLLLAATIVLTIAPLVEAKPKSDEDIIYSRVCAAYRSGQYTMREVFDFTEYSVRNSTLVSRIPVTTEPALTMAKDMENMQVSAWKKTIFKKVVKNCN